MAVSLRIGLAVGQREIRVIGLRGGCVWWAGAAERTLSEPLADTIAGLIDQLPRKRLDRSRVVAAIGPAHAQVKRLYGLPPVSDRRLATKLVREGASRFFIMRAGSLLTTDIHFAADGATWAAAFDRCIVESIEDACREVHAHLEGIVASVTVLSKSIEGDTIQWSDGDVGMVVCVSEGELRDLRRIPAAASQEPRCEEPELGEPLSALGPEGLRFADAFGAATLSRPVELTLRSGDGRLKVVPAWRITLAATAALVALGGAFISPLAVAREENREVETHLAMLASRRAAVADDLVKLADVNQALTEIAAFASSDRSVVQLLSALTQALPDGSAIISLHVTKGDGDLVALTPRAASFINRLGRTSGVAAPSIIGPVTREVIGGRELERVAISFRVNWPDTLQENGPEQ
jgi:hypothetical protein